MEFPKMIYLGGDLAAEWRIVDDEEGEAQAEKDGFFPHDRKPTEKPVATPAADEPVKERKKPGPKPKGAQ